MIALLILICTNFGGSFAFDRIRIELFEGRSPDPVTYYSSKAFPDVPALFNVNGYDVKALTIQYTAIESLDANVLRKLSRIESLVIAYNKQLKEVGSKVFDNNTNLSELSLAENGIHYIASDAFLGVFQKAGTEGTINLRSNKLQVFPSFSLSLPGVTSLNLDDNPIQVINFDALKSLPRLTRLSIEGTLLTQIGGSIFQQAPNLAILYLSRNWKLRTLDAETFTGCANLKELYLSDTLISVLPHKGLENLVKLEVKGTPELWELSDGVVGIETLRYVDVSEEQSHLCCAFVMRRALVSRGLVKSSNVTGSNYQCSTSRPSTTSPAAASDSKGLLASSKTALDLPRGGNVSWDGFMGERRRRRDIEGFQDGFLEPTVTASDSTSSSNTSTAPVKARMKTVGDADPFLPHIPTVGHSDGSVICDNTHGDAVSSQFDVVICRPEPNAWRPCDDIIGNPFLTALSWIVCSIALLGNAAVFTVLILSRRSLTVTKFMLINLSFADLCLAFYLFLLVLASSYTHGSYYNFVRHWQFGGGCALTGFLVLFSSQLSTFVLVFITVERYYAIVYAMFLHKRLSMEQAKVCMVLSWLLAFVLAVLPLAGVNTYEKVAMCLPFRASSRVDVAYLGVLLILNVLLFLFVLVAYVRMYCVVRSPHLDCGTQRSDSEVAKRMALLVFTDFVCWVPIAFVGLLSAFGGSSTLSLDVKKSKYLLVFFLPVNSLCNPFLYALSTNTFRRDLFDLLLRCGLCQTRITKINEGVYSSRDGQPYSETQTSQMNSSFRKEAHGYFDSIKRFGRRKRASEFVAEQELSSTPLVITPTLAQVGRLNSYAVSDFPASNVPPAKQGLSCAPQKSAGAGWKDPVSSLDEAKSPSIVITVENDGKGDTTDLALTSVASDLSQYDLSVEAFMRSKESKLL